MLLTCDGLGKLVLPEADITVHLCAHHVCKDRVCVGPRAASVPGSGPNIYTPGGIWRFSGETGREGWRDERTGEGAGQGW